MYAESLPIASDAERLRWQGIRAAGLDFIYEVSIMTPNGDLPYTSAERWARVLRRARLYHSKYQVLGASGIWERALQGVSIPESLCNELRRNLCKGRPWPYVTHADIIGLDGKIFWPAPKEALIIDLTTPDCAYRWQSLAAGAPIAPVPRES